MKLLTAQYELVKESREVVFEFCEHFSNSDYLKEQVNFNKKSIRDLHVHVANSYLKWVVKFAMKKPVEFFNPAELSALEDIHEVYKKVNACVSDFLQRFQDQSEAAIQNEVDKIGIVTYTPLEIFTHVITHEFHHKGQILAMGRMMGYTPPDADIIRFNL